METSIEHALKRIVELEKELLDLKKSIRYNLQPEETVDIKKIRNNRYADFVRIEDK